MKLVILCGGEGSRIRDVSEVLPKPMLPIGGKPILWHIMKIYAAHGITDFILCLGYKGWLIKEFFLEYHTKIADFTITIGEQARIEFHDPIRESNWRVTLADTGDATMTGGRLWRVRKYLEGEDHFCLTYGDGVGNVDITTLIDHHKKAALAATVTAVRLAGRFGELNISSGRVTEFKEKPATTESRINGGFLVFDNKKIWNYLNEDPGLILERDPLTKLASSGQLAAFPHDGYWQSMDTPYEYAILNTAWSTGNAPWRVW